MLLGIIIFEGHRDVLEFACLFGRNFIIVILLDLF